MEANLNASLVQSDWIAALNPLCPTCHGQWALTGQDMAPPGTSVTDPIHHMPEAPHCGPGP